MDLVSDHAYQGQQCCTYEDFHKRTPTMKNRSSLDRHHMHQTDYITQTAHHHGYNFVSLDRPPPHLIASHSPTTAHPLSSPSNSIPINHCIIIPLLPPKPRQVQAPIPLLPRLRPSITGQIRQSRYDSGKITKRDRDREVNSWQNQAGEEVPAEAAGAEEEGTGGLVVLAGLWKLDRGE